MSLQKNNRYKEYILELEVCKEHLCKNEWGTPPLQRRFWTRRESLIKQQIELIPNSFFSGFFGLSMIFIG